MRNQAFRLSKYPQGKFSMDILDMVPLPLPHFTEGEFLVMQTHMSLNPVMHAWLQQSKLNHAPPMQIGEILQSYGVGKVIESLNPDFPVGAQVVGLTGWSEYILGNADMYLMDSSLAPEAILSLFYFTGLTAYVSLFKLAQPQQGQTLVITDAASAVGSLLGQLGKANGLKVVGMTDSDEKCQWLMDEIGFDSAINKHTEHLEVHLKAAVPDGIDIFFENTDEPIQELIYPQMNTYGRVIVTDMPESQQHKSRHIPDLMQIQHKRLSIQGFEVSDYLDLMQESHCVLAEYLMQGKIKYQAHVIDGFENLPETLIQYFNHAAPMGKLIVRF
ncbi:zinc-binding dehydrogenase [Acinetobacter sp. A7.4]|nr:NADP-dependent oxidoreductase [Acinetobacter sp. A7.4]